VIQFANLLHNCVRKSKLPVGVVGYISVYGQITNQLRQPEVFGCVFIGFVFVD